MTHASEKLSSMGSVCYYFMEGIFYNGGKVFIKQDHVGSFFGNAIILYL